MKSRITMAFVACRWRMYPALKIMPRVWPLPLDANAGKVVTTKAWKWKLWHWWVDRTVKGKQTRVPLLVISIKWYTTVSDSRKMLSVLFSRWGYRTGDDMPAILWHFREGNRPDVTSDWKLRRWLLVVRLLMVLSALWLCNRYSGKDLTIGTGWFRGFTSVRTWSDDFKTTLKVEWTSDVTVWFMVYSYVESVVAGV